MDVSLYIHIPFCTRKCHYCHFFVLPDKEIFKDQLMEGLFLEWEKVRPSLAGKKLVSIYFGGGTPFLLGPERIARLLKLFCAAPEMEITLEANPENISLQAMKDFAAAGINRVSIGMQTLDAPLLKKLGRLHAPQTATEAVHITKEAGIHNISIDLMYDLPGQTLSSWTQTLEKAISLPITHLSLYNLTIEPHTVFFKYRKELEREIPTEETSLEMLNQAEAILENAGLHRYEISAFARPGHYSKHNTGYWTGRPFLGLGPSAFSYWEGERYRNIAHLGRYLDNLRKGESPVDFREQLAPTEAARELVAVRLRLLQGISEDDSLILPAITADLETLCRQSDPLLEKQNNMYKLTKKGKLFYDWVASEII